MSLIVLLGLAFVAAPALAAGAIVWRRTLVMALPFLVILNGITIPVGGSSLRLDQLAACVLVVPLAAPFLTGARPLRTDATTWWLAAILAVNLVASALHSPALSYSVMQCANLASVWIIYLLLLNFLDTREELDAFVHRLLWAGIVASGIGIAAYVLAVSGVPVGGAEVSQRAAERLTNAYGAFGTMVEPNILGSFTAAHLVLAIALLFVAAHIRDGRHVRLLRWLAAISAVALVLSFTRAAWLGAIAGMICFVTLGARALGLRVRPSRILAPIALALAVMLVLLVLPGGAGTLFRFKLLNLVNLESQTAAVRLLTYAMAWQQTLDHPLIGWGTFTFAPLVAQGSDFQQFENWRNLWIGNYLLLALHDTGVMGLALWVGLLWTVVARGIRAARALSVVDPLLGGRTLALTAAVASLLVPFLATTGFSLGYAWLLTGLLGAHCRLAGAEGRAPIRPPLQERAPASIPEAQFAPRPADAT